MATTSLSKASFLLLALLTSQLFAANADEIKRQTLNLAQKHKLISAISEKINILRNKETVAESKLRKVEVSIGNHTKEIENLKNQAIALKHKITDLNHETKPLRINLQRQKDKLAQHIRLNFFIGQQDLLRIFFNQSGNKKITRSLSFQKYLQNRHVILFNKYQNALDQVENKQQQIQQQKTILKKNLAREKLVYANLNQELAQRKLLLQAIKSKLQDHKYSLNKHKADAKDLANLIQKLKVSIGTLPLTIKPDIKFARLKGKLLRPVHSANKISKPKDIKGVVFLAESGTKVRAIASGRVIFADWLRGYGLLTIVDHGAGYMSLYGGNQSLYREKGEWVQRGDLLARVGDTGGSGRSGLYFDIRLNGDSMPVLAWL